MSTSTYKKRDWSQYNQKLRGHARIEIFLSADVLSQWRYEGKRRPGGVVLYSDALIEACLLIREYFGLGLRQTQGFVQSLCDHLGLKQKAPDYTTLSRRCKGLRLRFPLPPSHKGGLVIAVDSTGLSVHSRYEWNRLKHQRGDYKWHEKWRKLHVALDVKTGLVLSAAYTNASASDAVMLPKLLDAIAAPLDTVAADGAYDTTISRLAIHARHARHLIPPNRRARLVCENRNLKPFAHALKERDEAIRFIRNQKIPGKDPGSARSAWKKSVGYHVRSHVETLMSRIKTHSSDKLLNRTEANREVQAMLKCKLVNLLWAC